MHAPCICLWAQINQFLVEVSVVERCRGSKRSFIENYTKIERPESRFSMSCYSSRSRCRRPWVVVVVIRVFRHTYILN